MTIALDWLRLCEDLGAKGQVQEIFEDIFCRYNESHRKYHTIKHIEHCLKEFAEVKKLANHPLEVEFALWFHDATYDIGKPDNVEASARLAYSRALQLSLPPQFADRSERLVLATSHTFSPTDDDERLIKDVDLTILGSPWEEFILYDNRIYWEHIQLINRKGMPYYTKSRGEVLRRFLGGEIYLTRHFKEKCEGRARLNLERLIDSRYTVSR